MDKKLSIRILTILSIVIVATLSYIQYDLVHKTYELTKERYSGEIKRRVSQMTGRPILDSFYKKAQVNLNLAVDIQDEKKIDKEQILKKIQEKNSNLNEKFNTYLFDSLKKVGLNGIRYKSQYEEIILEQGGVMDTLLNVGDKPIIFLGHSFSSSNKMLLNRNETVSIVDKNIQTGKASYGQKRKLIVSTSTYIDVSNWRPAIFKKMMGTLLLGIFLIFAVIVLLYTVFRTMIRQKKIADIKTDFANNITHELKTPLSSVSLILKSIERPEVRLDKELLDNLLVSLNRQYIKIHHIVDDVFESAMQSETAIKIEKIEIGSFLKDYFLDMRLEKHQLLVDIEPKACLLQTNPFLIEKILNVFIENAQKYSEPGKRITLNSNIDNGFYFIAVRDEGNGIKAEYQDHIFDKFYRLPEKDRQTVKGLGLGLFLAKKAAEKINATLMLKSASRNGSIFLIKLPI